jgi:ubiquitin thioesterase protein OTUB1
LEEETRLRSLHNLLNTIGFQEDLYEDFADECFELLRKTAASVPAADDSAAASLLTSFNDVGLSMAIITYFKVGCCQPYDSRLRAPYLNIHSEESGLITFLQLLTSAWIQTHANDFQPFLLDQDIREYCATQIEPSICEIDHVGMAALAEVLVKPAGLALEVLYLDRSPGEEINTYRIDPLGHDGIPIPDPPTLRLLYRP